MRLKLFTMSLIAIAGFETTGAQYTLVSAGGTASGTGGSASYSVGQIAYTYTENNSGSLSAGVQQTYEIIEVTGIAEIDAMLSSIFPTQVVDFLSVVTETDEFKELEFRVFNLAGKLMKSGKIRNKLTKIYVGDLVKSTYLIEVFNGNVMSGSFKFIKN